MAVFLIWALSAWLGLESEVLHSLLPAAPTGIMHPLRSGVYCLWAQVWLSNAALRYKGTEHLTAQPVHGQGPLGPPHHSGTEGVLADNRRPWLHAHHVWLPQVERGAGWLNTSRVQPPHRGPLGSPTYTPAGTLFAHLTVFLLIPTMHWDEEGAFHSPSSWLI